MRDARVKQKRNSEKTHSEHKQRTFGSENEFVKWNDRMFVKYNNERVYYHPNPLIRWVEHERVCTLLRFARPQDNENVLEVGCGEGYIMRKLKHGNLYGIDISKIAIDRAKERLRGNPQVRKLAVANAERIPFPKNTFDVVYCSEVIEHVLDPEKVIGEMVRVAKSNARIVITFPNEQLINRLKSIVKATGLFKLLLPNIPERMDDEWHLHAFSRSLFNKVIQGKLVVRRMRGAPLSILPIRYVALCKRA